MGEQNRKYLKYVLCAQNFICEIIGWLFNVLVVSCVRGFYSKKVCERKCSFLDDDDFKISSTFFFFPNLTNIIVREIEPVFSFQRDLLTSPVVIIIKILHFPKKKRKKLLKKVFWKRFF